MTRSSGETARKEETFILMGSPGGKLTRRNHMAETTKMEQTSVSHIMQRGQVCGSDLTEEVTLEGRLE